MRRCRVIELGRMRWADAFALQRREVERLQRGEGDDVWAFVEHPHVITAGRNADGTALRVDPDWLRARGADVETTDRGGDVTYHGPGQIVGYPLLRLEGDRRDIRRYVHDLEQVLIDALADFGIEARRHDVHRGVWVGPRKIASLGIRISRWVTSHGFALNVHTNLAWFGVMEPCGIAGCEMTSMARELGRDVDGVAVKRAIVRHAARRLELEMTIEGALAPVATRAQAAKDSPVPGHGRRGGLAPLAGAPGVPAAPAAGPLDAATPGPAKENQPTDTPERMAADDVAA